MTKTRPSSCGVRRAERASCRTKLRTEALRVLVLVVFLGFLSGPFNNHLKRTETQASEKQGNDYGALDVVVVVDVVESNTASLFDSSVAETETRTNSEDWTEERRAF